MKYQFYAIVFDVAGNQVSSRSSSSPLAITTSTQLVTGLTISPSASQTKNVGETFTITPTVGPSNANNKNVNWTSSNTNVATVSKSSTASGTAVTVTCKAAGTATIIATAADGSGKSANVSLTVYDKVTVTAFSYSSTSINVGQVTAVPTKTITGTAKSGPTYSSSNTSVATVASDGKVTGVSNGTATITISYTNYDGTTSTKTCSISVYNKVTITTFTYSSTNINVGATSASPTKSITGTAKSGPTYSSSNTSIATVNSSTGVVTGKAAGTATITIKYTNYDGTAISKTARITVNSSMSYGPLIVMNAYGANINNKSSKVVNIALDTSGLDYLGKGTSSNTDPGMFIGFKVRFTKVANKTNTTSSWSDSNGTCTEYKTAGGLNAYSICCFITNDEVYWRVTLEDNTYVYARVTSTGTGTSRKIASVTIQDTDF